MLLILFDNGILFSVLYFQADLWLYYNRLKHKRMVHDLMKITDIRIRIVKKDDNKLKAVASLTIDDCFAVHDIKVIDGNQGLFIAMPSRKTPEGNYKDIVHPLNTETREQIKELILAEYEKALQAAPAE